jgi:hypothetical protein
MQFMIKFSFILLTASLTVLAVAPSRVADGCNVQVQYKAETNSLENGDPTRSNSSFLISGSPLS